MTVKKLEQYSKKRNFKNTPEPSGRSKVTKKKLNPIFVIQKHHASHLHYDFRLEIDGVLKSWAVPKGPSSKIGEKRLAVMTEDHPLEYANFEGTIPKGNYGAGKVIIWDRGEWICHGDVDEQLKKGHLSFELKGNRLNGNWHLVRMHNRGANNWLLMKAQDQSSLSKAS